MALMPPEYLDSVIAIGFRNDDDVFYNSTGFMYGRYLDDADGYLVFLITNRHVLEGQDQAILRFNPEPGRRAKAFPIELTKKDGTRTWVGHPDSEIDVAAALLDVDVLDEHGIPARFFAEDEHVLFFDDQRAHHLSEGDGVFIIGFPMGEVGEERNYAVVRNGCVARVRDTLADDSSEFLVDGFIFPGNSGGPLVLKPELTSVGNTESFQQAYLIGIVSSYLPYRYVAISQQTQRPRVIFEENSGLAAVFPPDRIREAVERAMTQLEGQIDETEEADEEHAA